MRIFVIEEQEAINQGIDLTHMDEVFDYVSIETIEEDLKYYHGSRYHFSKKSLEKAKDYVIYKIDNPYNTELVINNLIKKGILL